MKIKILSTVIQNALAQCGKFVDPKSQLPGHNAVRISADAEGVEFEVRGPHSSYKAAVEAEVSREGEVFVSHGLFSRFLNSASGEVCLAEDKNLFRASFGSAKSSFGVFSRDDFPQPSEFKPMTTISFDGPKLHAAIKAVLPACRTTSSHKFAQIVCLEDDHAIATDGRTMHYVPLVGATDRMMIPSPFANALLESIKKPGAVGVLSGETEIAIQGDSWVAKTAGYNFDFPDKRTIANLLAVDYSKQILVNKKEFSSALSLCQKVCQEHINCRVSDKQLVVVAKSEGDEAEVVVEVLKNRRGEFNFCCNPAYILDGLGACDADEIELVSGDHFVTVFSGDSKFFTANIKR
jgi:DNA polymerase III sliding clamp (beta) subunit (PCNA family)